MNNQFSLNQLTIEKAAQKDWNEILDLLEKTGLKTNFSGNENFENFFLVKNNADNHLICCFAIDSENKVGILKSFAIKKELQGKGIGKIIVSKIPGLAKDLKLEKLYAASWEAPDFWEKTIFKKLGLSESKDDYFLNYASYLVKNFSQYSKQTRHFILEI